MFLQINKDGHPMSNKPDKPVHPIHPEHPPKPEYPPKPDHPNRITILVNGEEKLLLPHVKEISYEEIVKLAYGMLPTNPNTIYTVAYSNGPSSNVKGTLTKGRSVMVKEGMVFNVSKVINLNSDLKQLRDEGYEIEIKEGHAIAHNVPYLDNKKIVQYGTLVSPLAMRGDTVYYENSGTAHVIYFQGLRPHCATGEPISGLILSTNRKTVAGINVDFAFSNKPQGGYHNYHEKFLRYITILQVEAQAVDPSVNAATFRHIASDDDSVFVYMDTNSSRATITDITDKLRDQKIGIIGMGGTGSYILDQIAKTPVSEIHIYDGDIFCQHNAFRAPGAPIKEILEQVPLKVDYFSKIYGHMHKGIKTHPSFVTEANVEELTSLDFVFLCIDTGEHKRTIINKLTECCIPFVDTGIDIIENKGALIGTARTTACCLDNNLNATDQEIIDNNISFASVTDNDLYQSNIQTADLNAFCALMAVIKWKKHCGFYQDLCPHQNRIYNTNDGEFK